MVPDTINIKVLVSPPNTPEIKETCKALFGSPFEPLYTRQGGYCICRCSGVLIKIAGIDHHILPQNKLLTEI